jgi:hypothetical protein
MDLALERLFLLAAPFFAAAVVSKRKKANKPPRKKLQAPRTAAVKRSKKPAPRVARLARKRPPVAKKGAVRGRAPMPAKPPQKPVKPAPAEIPEPVPVAPVGRPILLSPEQGKYADSINPRFRWLSVGGATRYEVNWGQDPNLANAYTVVSVATEAVVPVEKPLSIGVTYYWRVRGGNEAGWGPWSTTGSFSVLEETD